MIDPEDLKRAQEEAKRSGISIADAMLSLGLIGEVPLLQFMSRQYGVPAVDLDRRAISSSAIGLINREVALRLMVLPIEKLGSVLLVAVVDPSIDDAIRELERLTGLDVEVLVSTRRAIRAAIDVHYGPPGSAESC